VYPPPLAINIRSIIIESLGSYCVLLVTHAVANLVPQYAVDAISIGEGGDKL
jgi:sRNA-binding regulator protein Hfq